MWSAIIASSRKRFIDIVQPMIDAFKIRILSNGGIFEAESCLYTQLTELNNNSLLENASLIVTPNGYKESRLYSIIPEDDSGTFIFSRSSMATRINSDGFLELMPNNLVVQSEDFSSNWLLQRISIIENAITSPIGTSNGTKLVGSVGETYSYVGGSPTNLVLGTPRPQENVLHNISFYLKYGGLDRIRVILGGASTLGGSLFVEVDLFNGIITNNSVGITNPFIIPVSNGWYRVGFSNFLDISPTNNRIAVGLGDSVKTVADGIDGVYVWGAQLSIGEELRDYVAVNTRNAFPKIDYSDGNCSSIVSEPARSNQIILPNELGGEISSTKTLNYGISPEGNMNSFLIEFGSTSTNGVLMGINNNTGVQTFTLSFWARVHPDSTSNRFGFRVTDINNNISVATTNYFVTSEWQRYSQTFTSDGIGTNTRFLNGQNDVSGKIIEFFGVQIEIGNSMTSYIRRPQIGTRGLDTYLLQGTEAENIIGQEEGTIFLKGVYLNRGIVFRLTNTSSTTVNRLSVFCNGTNGQMSITIAKNNVQQTLSNIGLNPPLLVVRYTLDNFSVFVNGVLTRNYDYPSPTPFSQVLNRIQFGYVSESAQCNFENIVMWKTALSDQECINLTTP